VKARLGVCVGLLLAVGAGCFRASPPAADRLLHLVAERLALMGDVARAKWNAKAPVSDPARELAFLDQMAAAGRQYKLDPVFTTKFFAAQIVAAKMVQEEAIHQWNREQRPPFPKVPDLKDDLRPKIDGVSRDMLPALAAFRSGPHTPPDVIRRLAADHLHSYPPHVRDAAIGPLIELSSP
jgi:chorismate mutase-like protein